MMGLGRGRANQMAIGLEQLRGGVIGLLVGDALGVPYEFHAARDLPARELIEMEPPRGFRRAHAGVPIGTWSDDGAQALCLLASLLDRDRFDPEDFGQRLVRWFQAGYLAVDGVVFDVGITSRAAISAIARGTPAREAGPCGERDNGNGSLMRVLPLALWHRGSDAELVHDAMRQSCVTHGHLRSQVCCAVYCLWARGIGNGEADPWIWAITRLDDLWGDNLAARAELKKVVDPEAAAPISGSGYVVDCLRSAEWATRQGDYEQVVRAAISLGNDTDTTACVAGGIAGWRDGLSAIPVRWREALRGGELVEPLLDRLCSRLSPG